MWTKAVDIYCVREIRMKTDIFLGAGSLACLENMIETWKEEKIDSILLLAGKNSFSASGAEKEVIRVLKNSGIKWNIFFCPEKIQTLSLPDLAAEEGRKINAKAILAVGGRRISDTAKCASLLLAAEEKYTAKDLAEGSYIPQKALPIILVNTSHGSGSENNSFATFFLPEEMAYYEISSPLVYPQKVISDPFLARSLPRKETRYAAISAVNHALESATGKNANPMSIFLAHEVIKLVSRYLPVLEKSPDDLSARYFLLFASLLAGLAADNGGSNFVHALLKQMKQLKPDLPHALGVTMLMPAVVKKVYPEHGKVLASLLAPIVPDLSGNAEEAEDAAAGLETWIAGFGVVLNPADVRFLRENIDELVETSYQNPSLSLLLTVSPLESAKDVIRSIFDDALTSSGKEKI